MNGVTPFGCPLCGSPARLEHHAISDAFAVACTNSQFRNIPDPGCGITGPERRTQLEAIAVWNKRALLPPVLELEGKVPLVLYFQTREDAEEMIKATREAFPNPVEYKLP